MNKFKPTYTDVTDWNYLPTKHRLSTDQVPMELDNISVEVRILLKTIDGEMSRKAKMSIDLGSTDIYNAQSRCEIGTGY